MYLAFPIALPLLSQWISIMMLVPSTSRNWCLSMSCLGQEGRSLCQTGPQTAQQAEPGHSDKPKAGQGEDTGTRFGGGEILGWLHVSRGPTAKRKVVLVGTPYPSGCNCWLLLSTASPSPREHPWKTKSSVSDGLCEHPQRMASPRPRALCCYLIAVHIESHALTASIEVDPELLQLLIWWFLHLRKNSSSAAMPRKIPQLPHSQVP